MSPAPHPDGSQHVRITGLDLLRLAAILLVLGRHLPPPPDSWPPALVTLLKIWFRGGWIGVDLFFVLSGFLVSGLLFSGYQSGGRLGIGRFFIRRAFKIYPPFFVFLGCTCAIRWIRGQDLPPASVLSEMLFLQSYIPGLWNHTWSLAVEEHFYLLLPLCLFLCCRWPRKSLPTLSPVPWICALSVLACLGFRLAAALMDPGYSCMSHHPATHLRLDALFFGVAISHAYHFHRATFLRLAQPRRRSLAILGILLLALAFVFDLETSPWMHTFGLTVVYLGSGSLLTGVLLHGAPDSRPCRFLAGLGAASYSVYLWHMPVLVWGAALIQRAAGGSVPFSGIVAAYLLGSFVFGVLMARLVETPALRLRDRWFPRLSLPATGPRHGSNP